MRPGHRKSARRRSDFSCSNLSAKILQAQDQERRRMARELHDTMAQSLSSLAINMEILGRCSSAITEQGRRALVDSTNLVKQCLSEVRSLAYLLHPPILDGLGLAEALKWFVAGYSDRSRIEVHLSIPDDLGRLARDVELTIYRIVQESLVNVQQHSASTVAAIGVIKDSKGIRVDISDQGGGFRFPASQKASLGVGILGM